MIRLRGWMKKEKKLANLCFFWRIRFLLTLSSSKRFCTFSFAIAADISATCFCTAGSAIAAFRASGSGMPPGMLAALQMTCRVDDDDDRASTVLAVAVGGSALRPLQLTAEEEEVRAERGIIATTS